MLGARPLRRALQRDIEDVLAEDPVRGAKAGEIVVVDVARRRIEDPFTFTGAAKAEAPDLLPAEFTRRPVGSGPANDAPSKTA